ncbi:GNAT family acetyltransferase [Drechmeria coniospora]|uniref:GNAT family acetyltransferase n=1 Tax=Drechmeria coniospora TaxID=98403 RepID=A0A151GVF0_DRECN|nr:GNAT family acetyltransferase [Drechmeria coniospora]KYK61050.1 GNAT family acetyltransferase [Drechmeria coniospora]ODA80818.1 hypothetical protein RJ55_03778 [Drechmeria coniospora]
MPLHVLPALLADAPRAVAMESRAYGPSRVSAALFPGPRPPSGDDVRVANLRNSLRDDDACRWAKVIDTDLHVDADADADTSIIAFSKWYFWTAGRDELPAPSPWGPGANADACELYFGSMRGEWTKRMAGKPHAYLKLLHTDPEHQRRGAASMLLRWGAAEADRLGLPTYLEASEEGAPLYEKHGFRPVHTIVTDLSRWNGPSNAKVVIMLRPFSDSAS